MLFTFTTFNILDTRDKAWSRRSTLTFTTCVCVCVFSNTFLQPTTWSTGRCIKCFNQSPLKKISIFQGFLCMASRCIRTFTFSSHLALDVSSNGHWNDKFHEAWNPMAIIYHLRPVKYTLKVFKWTAPQDKTRSPDMSEHTRSPAAVFSMN